MRIVQLAFVSGSRHLIGVIVPRRLRADWRQEWAALRYREALLADWDLLDWSHKLNLLWRSTSAFWDALWLQPKRLEDEVSRLALRYQNAPKHKGFYVCSCAYPGAGNRRQHCDL